MDDYVQAVYRRKSISMFMVEMNRPPAWWMQRWMRGE